MKKSFRWYVFCFGILLLSACTRKSDSSSVVRFTLPAAPVEISKASVGKLGAPTFCYFVNVTGPGITSVSPSCAPAQGTGNGFADPFSTISLSVLKGDSRTVELYGYLPAAGEHCGSLSANLSAVPLNRLFLLDHKTGVNMTGDQTDINLTVVFPGLNQHYGVQASLPTTCYASLPAVPSLIAGSNPYGFHLSGSAQIAFQQGVPKSSAVHLIGNVGTPVPHRQAQSAGAKLIVK